MKPSTSFFEETSTSEDENGNNIEDQDALLARYIVASMVILVKTNKFKLF